jgi:hypothetical protein
MSSERSRSSSPSQLWLDRIVVTYGVFYLVIFINIILCNKDVHCFLYTKSSYV